MGAAARVFPGFTLKLESSDQDTDANEALEAAPLTTKEGRL
jgi:hypothetical protein